MKLPAFFILALLTLLVQGTLVPQLEVAGARPDLLFILAVHYALWGPWPDAALAGWVLGLLVDLQSHGRVGLHAFAFGAAAWAIVRVRQILFRDHWMAQIVVTFVFCMIVRVGVTAYDTYRGGDLSVPFWSETIFGVSLYTAMFTPVLHWPLIRIHRWTGLKPTQRTALSAA